MTHRAIYLSADLLDLLLASACTRTGNTDGTHYTPGKTEATQASACSTVAQRTLDTMVRAIRGSAFRITTQGLRPSASARTVKHPAAGETVTTLYHYLRPTERQYSKIPHNNVQYSYNAYGQLSVVQDGCGRSVFYYDAMGNVSKNVRTRCGGSEVRRLLI